MLVEKRNGLELFKRIILTGKIEGNFTVELTALKLNFSIFLSNKNEKKILRAR